MCLLPQLIRWEFGAGQFREEGSSLTVDQGLRWMMIAMFMLPDIMKMKFHLGHSTEQV